MTKLKPHRDPIGTIRKGENCGALAYAIRWNENAPNVGWRIIDMKGGDWLECDDNVRDWTVVYRPGREKSW